MTLSLSINSQTILKSRVWLHGDEQVEKTEMEGQQPLPRHGGGWGRRGASSSSSVSPDTFQIIRERIDGLRDVADVHSNRLVDI